MNLPRQILFSFFASVALTMVLTPQARAITGGTYTSEARYSAIVKIRANFGTNGERYGCTGTFISPRHILTAGHCLIDLEKGVAHQAVSIDFSQFPKMDLFWNENKFAPPRVIFHVHPLYLANPKPSNPDDIGVIELDRDASSTFLPINKTAPVKGQTVTIAGYGCDKREQKWSTDFKIGVVEISKVEKFLDLKTSKVNAGVEYCEGDSGGPVLIETPQGPRIVGLATYTNLFKGLLGFSKDRSVRLDQQARNSSRAWIDSILQAK
jgi:V8-like Glu-specific endopeptidase